MNNRVQELVERYELLPHPEGGFYKETFRSSTSLPGKDRQLATAIYFLLRSEDISRLHAIASEELWFFHEGSPLIVHTLDANGPQQHLLGNDLANGEQPQLLVPAGTIFGSSVVEPNSYSFVSCVCAFGFDFRDFKLFETRELTALYPEHTAFIEWMTGANRAQI